MSRYVVDASVGLKWFLPEVHASAARRLLSGEHVLLVPDLFFAEFGNILWKKIGRGEMSEAEGHAVLSALGTVALHGTDTRSLLRPAFEIACRTRRTVYDSVYLALAFREGARLVTADERLVNGLAADPLAPHLLWVEDVPTGP